MKKWPAIPLLAAGLVVFPMLVDADNFRLGVLPDTQKTVEEAPEVFLAQIEWILRNRADPDNPIAYVATLGDMKDDNFCDVKNVVNPETGATMSEWQILNFGYLKLDNAAPRIPYGVVPGNHDYNPITSACFLGDPNDATNRRLTGYNQFFGPNRFSGAAFYGGSDAPGDNEDNYTLFSSHGIDFIAINLGYRASAYPEEPGGDCPAPGNPRQLHDLASHDDSLCDLRDGAGNDLHATELHWADGLLDQFPNRLAIITAHYIMDGNRDRFSGNFRSSAFGDYAQQLFDYLGRHRNLFMMLGAHERGEAWIVNNRAGMPPVHAMLANYQDLDFPNDGASLTDPATYANLPQHNGGSSHPNSNTPWPRHDNSFSGFMRQMTFDTDTGLVDIETFMPLIPANVVANVTTTYAARRALPANAAPPNDRIPSTRSIDQTTNDNVVDAGEVAPGLSLTHRTATNINDISFVGYVNLPPTATGVAIVDNNGGTADVGDTLTGIYSYNDLDGDADNSSFRWLRNGLPVVGDPGQTFGENYTLVAADAGQQISFEVTPAADAGPVGVPVSSAAVTVTAAPQGPQPFVQSGSLANDAFFRFLAGSVIPASVVNDRCADGDGCRVTLTRVYGGATTTFGPINFANIPGANQFRILDANGNVIRTGTSANGQTEEILGPRANTNCWFSDWDTSGNTGNGDQNGNFAVIIWNSTATNLSCTIRIED